MNKQIKEMREQINKVKNYNQVYYRALPNFEGESLTFEPKGYYEATDDEGNPIMHKGDVWVKSDKPEIAASKTIGGAILGLWSMRNHHGLNFDSAYIYQINEVPYKDLSHLRTDDFEWLKEVRYNKPVNAKYIGKFPYTDEFNKSAVNFYERLHRDPWDEDTEIDVDDWEDFERKILTMNKNELQ